MAFPLKKKPDFAMMLAMGPKRTPEIAPPDMASDPEPDPADPNEPSENEGADLTPDMLHYSGSDQHCSACSHFTAPTTCDRWSDPVEEAGHCEGFQSGGSMSEADQMPDADQMPMGDEDQAA